MPLSLVRPMALCEEPAFDEIIFSIASDIRKATAVRAFAHHRSLRAESLICGFNAGRFGFRVGAADWPSFQAWAEPKWSVVLLGVAVNRMRSVALRTHNGKVHDLGTLITRPTTSLIDGFFLACHPIKNETYLATRASPPVHGIELTA
ncbi:hypothetical protein [Dongia sedimenti]|uniref:Uncharacterized protein n=1 Tax=Dongia sedimenti TaxID=3064282 RepID=A0ABU0YHC2_9PROT|nr:hypothetical protein [Rhodospirillaceae bacterium R-7]